MRSIPIVNHCGSIQLKFSFCGKRFSFNPIPGGEYADKRDRELAQSIATRIQNDILADNFDPTLDRYRIGKKIQTATVKVQKAIELWDRWVDTLNLTPENKNDKYRYTRRMLEHTDPGVYDSSWFVNCTLAASTYRDRLCLLRACFEWGVKEGLVDRNPYTLIKTKKQNKTAIKPFTTEELEKIFSGFQTYSPHYTPFVKFLVATGVRTSEAIGIQWKHIDFDRKLIEISESLPKDRSGNGYTRKRKTTKNDSIRFLKMPIGLEKLLRSIEPTTMDKNALLFTTKKGCVIDADNWREDEWKRVLTLMGVKYRKPYTLRHTTASVAIDQGASIVDVAYILGHSSPRITLETYSHIIQKPDLPNIKID